MGKAGKPKSFDRFLIQANACIGHDAYGELEKIPGSQLFMYEGLGHGLYEEAKDFHKRIQSFLSE